MLTNNKPSLNNLVSISSAGLKVATFAEIKQALIDQYKFIYGLDIDVDDTTADGVFINTNATIINNILQSLQIMYSNLDINTASGEFLDVLCRLSNVFRKPATKSNVNVAVTYFGPSTITYTPDDLTFVDKAGIEWSALQNVTFNANETKSVYIECKKEGPITAPAGWISNVVDASIPISVSQSDDAYVGRNEESDFSLRSRQISSGSGAGISTISSLQSALLSVLGIDDVYIYNYISQDMIGLADYTLLVPHTVYIILRYQEGVILSDKQIANIIYDHLTVGINTADVHEHVKDGTKHEYLIDYSIAGISSSLFERQTVSWKEAEPIHPAMSFYMEIYPNFSTSEFEEIANYLMTYFNNLHIAYLPSRDELYVKFIQADPKNKGSATYTCTDIKQDGEPYEKDESINTFTYFNYTNYSVLGDATDGYILVLR